MKKEFNLTIEEMIVVLFELGAVEQARALIVSLEELGNPEMIDTTLKVATRSLISKGIVAVENEEFVFNTTFKKLIESFLDPKTTLRVSKVYNDAELQLLVFKAEEDMYIVHSTDEFIFSFSLFEDFNELADSLCIFSNINEGEQMVTEPLLLTEDVSKIIFETEEDMQKDNLLANHVPEHLVESIMDDFNTIRNIHSYVVINEELEFIHPLLIVESNLHSWMSSETVEAIQFESFTNEKLKAYLTDSFMAGNGKCAV